ncbi:MAG: hypothetical protein EOP09_06875 [Proteobacteria bacterium]|nr:MAG: hypothetical protein EOP09_06875 [Pseudomonadota bacterium]
MVRVLTISLVHIAAVLALGLSACAREVAHSSPTQTPPRDDTPVVLRAKNFSTGFEALVAGGLRHPTPSTQIELIEPKLFLTRSDQGLIQASACYAGRRVGESDCLLAVQEGAGGPYAFSTRVEKIKDPSELAQAITQINHSSEQVRAIVGDRKEGYLVIAQSPKFGEKTPQFEHRLVRASSGKSLRSVLADFAYDGYVLTALLKVPASFDYYGVVSRLVGEASEPFEVQTAETENVPATTREFAQAGYVVKSVTRSRASRAAPIVALVVAYRQNTVVAALRGGALSANYSSQAHSEFSIAGRSWEAGRFAISALDLDSCVNEGEMDKACHAVAIGYRF